MGKGDSESRQESLTQAAEQALEAEGSSTAVQLGNVRGDSTITIDQDGIDGETFERVAAVFAGTAEAVASQASSQASRTSEALERIAMNQAGAETETGRLIEQLTIPAAIAAAGAFGLAILLRR